MKIKNIDKSTAVMLGDELFEAAQKIASKYGLQAKRGGGRYDSGEYKLNNVVLFVPGASGASEGMVPSKANKLKTSWNMHRGYYDLKHIEVGQKFSNFKGENMELLGWDSKKRKYPVIVKNLDNGGQYKMSAKVFKDQLYSV